MAKIKQRLYTQAELDARLNTAYLDEISRRNETEERKNFQTIAQTIEKSRLPDTAVLVASALVSEGTELTTTYIPLGHLKQALRFARKLAFKTD